VKRLNGLAQAKAYFAAVRQAGTSELPAGMRNRVREAFGADLTAQEVAALIIEAVRRDGDEALFFLSAKLDSEPLGFLEIPRPRIDAAAESLSSETRTALETATRRVTEFQSAAMPSSWYDEERRYGEIVAPLARIGAYVPAGTAPLVSTVLMTVVPARVAGVEEVVLATPAPGDSLPHPAVLAAAAIAGVDRVFKIGGAQAVAALAYGTQTVPRVDLVCGPGNVFVTAAKKLVFGDVGVDGLYGPTETVVIADESADPEYAAADLLAQAEHDQMARPVLIATSARVADAIEAAMAARLRDLPRRAVVETALADNGIAVVVSNVEQAVEAANAFAPEHLCLAVKDAARYVDLVRAAGGLFLGECSAEVIGDYVAGPSHVMPTEGTARFASALSVRHFLRVMPRMDLDEEAFLNIAPAAAELARIEGLDAHAEAAQLRLRRMLGE